MHIIISQRLKANKEIKLILDIYILNTMIQQYMVPYFCFHIDIEAIQLLWINRRSFDSAFQGIKYVFVLRETQGNIAMSYINVAYINSDHEF